MAKLSETSEAMIAITFIVMNLEKWLKMPLFVPFFAFLEQKMAGIFATFRIMKKNLLQIAFGKCVFLSCQRA